MVIQFRNVFSVLPILLFPFQISAWTIPINISNTDSLSTSPAMCMDKRGWLHVVWEDNTQGNYDIYYIYYNGSTWVDTQNVSHDPNTCITPDIAVDTLNNVHIVWSDYTTGRIMWTMYDGGNWSSPASISDDVPYACQGSELDVSLVNNYVHCVWHNLSADIECEIWHTYFNGNIWSAPENVTNDPSRSIWPDVAVDSLGRIHLVWMNWDGGSLDSGEIFYSRFDSISWTSPVNVSRTIGGSVDPRIAIDRDNNPRVIWEERKNGYSVYYTYFDGLEWVNPMLVDSIDAYEPDIAVGKENKVYVVYSYDYEIYYVIYNDTLQETPPIDISNTGSSILPVICIDSISAHVIWQDGSMDSTTPKKNIEIFYNYNALSGIKNIEKSEISYPSIVFSKIRFSFPSPKKVSIRIYDVMGRKMKDVVLQKVTTDIEIPLDLSSGIYFFRFQYGNQTICGKFLLLR